MQQIPLLRIELEGLKQNVTMMFNQNNEALNKMVLDTLEKTLTEKWVQEKVNQEVTNCIEAAIKEISNNWKLRSAITDLISSSINELVIKENKN